MKYCKECGFQLDDSAVFCPNCGSKQEEGQTSLGAGSSNSNPVGEVTPNNMYGQSSYEQNGYGQNGYEQNAYGQSGYEQNTYGQNDFYQEVYNQGNYAQNNYAQGSFGQPPVKNKSKAPAIIGISVGIVTVIALVVGIIFLSISGGGNSAKGVANNFLKAYSKFDGTKMVKYIAYSKDYQDDIKEFVDEFDSNKSYASLIDMSYKIKSTKKLSKSDAEDFWDEYGYETYVDKDDVKELTEVKVLITVSILGEKDSEDMILYVGKYKGKWKVIDFV